MNTFNTKPETDASVESAKRRYRELVAAQRKLPLSEQWTMAGEIKRAKAEALTRIEAFRFGQ